MIRVLEMVQEPVGGVEIPVDEIGRGNGQETEVPGLFQRLGQGLVFRAFQGNPSQVGTGGGNAKKHVEAGTIFSKPKVKKLANSHKEPPMGKWICGKGL